jgi:hypothetical protein
MSKNDIDLNIDNYNINDLLLFLGLKKNYTATDLDNKEKEYILNVVSSDTNSITPQKKYDLITFIKNAKSLLLDNINSGSESKGTAAAAAETKGAATTLAPGADQPNDIKIGQVINPRSNIPAMQFSKNAIELNGYKRNTIIRNYIFNTVFRDNFFETYSTDSTYTLPQKMTNVISLDLSGIQFPNFAFAFSEDKGSNKIYIEEEETGLSALVLIPSGNYNITNFPVVLAKCINEQVVGEYNPDGPNRFNVSISETTYFTTISNTTYSFFMILNDPEFNNNPDDYKCPNIYGTRYFKTNFDARIGTRPEEAVNTLGWLMGYRLPGYAFEKSYTSEGPFDNTYSDYLYFTLNDYVNNQTSNTYGILPTSILDNNILAMIPVTAPVFTSSFDNNSNFIYKTRLYTGPVNITKITIGLINQFGEEVNLHNSDFAFCLQITSIFDAATSSFS